MTANLTAARERKKDNLSQFSSLQLCSVIVNLLPLPSLIDLYTELWASLSIFPTLLLLLCSVVSLISFEKGWLNLQTFYGAQRIYIYKTKKTSGNKASISSAAEIPTVDIGDSVWHKNVATRPGFKSPVSHKLSRLITTKITCKDVRL